MASLLALVSSTVSLAPGQGLRPDERPARAGEWGIRPGQGASVDVNPPAFVWRPERSAARYYWQASRTADFREIAHETESLRLPVFCPPFEMEPGRWHWRFAFAEKDGERSAWSRVRSFVIPEDARVFVLPERNELLSRVPERHPRLFVRPEDLPRLRELAKGARRRQFAALLRSCDQLLEKPPPTEEPPLYPRGVRRGSEAWRRIWWGNRTYTIRALESAATLAFTRLLGGSESYGKLAKRLLLACARWNPRGSTGYRYNDEAGMPYAYHFSRTYSFVHDLLSEKQQELCRDVMRVRGREMYAQLCPRHLGRPFGSHANRAWHFLGEIGIAFLGEIEEAADWLWFATRVFGAVYPVWSDSDGGWHEGINYWRSYIGRFTWWADIMRASLGIDAYRKPYFSRVGDYPLYLQPPGTSGGGFGDLSAMRRSRDNVPLMALFAARAQNPYWQWYVEAHGPYAGEPGYIGFLRGALPEVEARAPLNLPSSKCFRGTGQAYLNSSLLDARDNVQVIFKSSPFGTQSHGYEAQNSFLLYAFGERLLIRSGRRDSYGSRHHREWMWSTRSTNCIRVGGKGQHRRSPLALGRITAFDTSKEIDYVEGEAGEAYGGKLDYFRRGILFVKPELVIVFDRLGAPAPERFEWWLHAKEPFRISRTEVPRAEVRVGGAACELQWLAPPGLELEQTDEFDPPPRPRIKLVEHHLTARTRQAAREQVFVTVIRPFRVGERPTGPASLEKKEDGYLLRTLLRRGPFEALLPFDPERRPEAGLGR
ncbi:MAG: DUF4962 domain-containing protein [Planctomycetota bacterium]